jgi:hypothetical protein
MLTQKTVPRRSSRLANKPRVNYAEYEIDSENEMLEETGSKTTLHAFDLNTVPKAVMNQISSIKKMRLETGEPATLLPVCRSTRLSVKYEDDVSDCMSRLVVSPSIIGANSGKLFNEVITRPEFMEPNTTNSIIQSDLSEESLSSTEYGTEEYMQNHLKALLENISTSTDTYGDVITIAEIINAFPRLVENESTRIAFGEFGNVVRQEFLNDKTVLKSDRAFAIADSISILLGLA